MSKKLRENSSKAGLGKSAAAAKKAAVKTSPATKTASHKKLTAAASATKPASKVSKKKAVPLSPSKAPPADTPVKGANLVEGTKAPPFALVRDGGKTVSLADYAGQRLVLFFYPRANTPGCTREAVDFTRLAKDFAAAKTAVLGVSADPLKAQNAFRDKHALQTPLLSDENHGMLEAYGAWGEKSMYGKTFQGVRRTTVLIGKDGRVARIWRSVKVEGHADEVLAAAKAG